MENGRTAYNEQLNERHFLTEVDHLNRYREPNGEHSQFALREVRKNLKPAVKEAAMPYATSTTYQEYHGGKYWWLDQTPEQVAASGYQFHEASAALARVDVEMEEACELNNLPPGFIKVMISPKMSRKDASYEVAKREHLADDDMIRIHMVDMGEDEKPRGKFMQSVLVRHIPLPAWVALLRDPNNLFGKAIEVEDEESALSVMKAHRELYVAEAALPKGVISLIEAVVPYADQASQAKIREELKLFETDQDELDRKADSIAERWLRFEMALANSLYEQYATEPIQKFIRGLALEWSDDIAQEVMSNTLPDGRVRMTRSLGAKLEASKRNTLWVSGGVATGNQRILQQLDPHIAQQIYINELFLQTAMREGNTAQAMQQLEITNDKIVAHQNVTAGGGCPGSGKGFFGSLAPKSSTSNETAHNDKKCPEVKDGQSVKCPGCKKQVRAIVPSREKIYCSNPQCGLAAPHLKGKAPKHSEPQPAENTPARPAAVSSESRVQAETPPRQVRPLGAMVLQA